LRKLSGSGRVNGIWKLFKLTATNYKAGQDEEKGRFVHKRMK